jgi:hypothetical protein
VITVFDAEKAVLDWLYGGATPTRPAVGSQAVGLSLGVPSSTSGSEITTGSGYTRQNLVMPAAASPAGSVTNTSSLSFGPFSGGASITGIQIWDTTVFLTGNMLMYGTLATARTVGVGDSLIIASGALTALMT